MSSNDDVLSAASSELDAALNAHEEPKKKETAPDLSKVSAAKLGINEARSFDKKWLFLIFVVAGVIVIAGTLFVPDGERKKDLAERAGAGDKYIPDLDIPNSKEVPETDGSASIEQTSSESERSQMSKEEADRILSGVSFSDEAKASSPQNPGTAPITSKPINSSNGTAKARPDTRKNTMRLEGVPGIVGLSKTSTPSAPDARSQWNAMDALAQNTNRRDDAIATLQQFAGQQFAGQQGGSSYDLVNGTSMKQGFYANQAAASGDVRRDGQYLGALAVYQGTVISAALESGINTDNPGVVIARVTENVYSSYDGGYLVIPAGSRLYATYNASISYAQTRVQVAWDLLIRPDGYSQKLGNMAGVDAEGFSGYQGDRTTHPWETFKALGLVGAFSILTTDVAQTIDTTDNQYAQNAMSDMYRASAQFSNKILDKALDIQPTITIDPGTEIKIITNVTLELPPMQDYPVTDKFVRY